ncbi:MAG: hypothetical protein ACI9OJ_004409, partial [Myxococcota bacterium]
MNNQIRFEMTDTKERAMFRSTTSSARMGAAFLCLNLMVVFAGVTMADSNPKTDNTKKYIPYSGVLEFDGQPVTGAREMRFTIYDGDGAEADVLWTEQQAVTVYQGRFEALLGSTTAAKEAQLATAVTFADDMQLQVAVKDNEGVWVEMAQRQRFLPSPFAGVARAAANLTVANILTVVGKTFLGITDIYAANIENELIVNGVA